MNTIRKRHIEIIVHAVFWLFILKAVNVNWSANWFDKTLRPNTPAPLSVLVFPFMFYAHSLWAIPRFLNRRRWKTYVLAFLLIYILPELLRAGLICLWYPQTNYWDELRSRDSFILGEPNVLWMAFTFSAAYRFSKDWFARQKPTERIVKNPNEQLVNKPSSIQPLNTEEVAILKEKLAHALQKNHAYLNQELSLAELAQVIDTTDKKLSTLLNQHLDTNFYDYINTFRIAAFKQGVSDGKLEQLSIIGLAFQCGFSSKSSFYRAFKKETGISPSQFIQ